MIRSFCNRGTEHVFNGVSSKAAREVCPRPVWGVAQRKLTQVHSVSELRHLAVPPGNHLEALRGSRDGQQSIRVSDQYRVCFRWAADGAHEVELVDYH